MTIAYRSSSLVTANNATGQASATISKPAGTVDGDLLIVGVWQVWATGTTNLPGLSVVPTGFDLLATYATSNNQNKRLSIYYKIAASEGASYTFTTEDPADGLAQRMALVMGAYSGVNSLNPIDVNYSEADHMLYSTTGYNPDQPNITTVNPGSMVLAFYSGYGVSDYIAAFGAPTTPAMTLRNSTVASNTRYIALADYLQPLGEALTIGAWTNTPLGGGGDIQAILMTVALRPASTPTPIVTDIAPDPIEEGSSATITGVDFEPYGADATVTIGPVSQTVSASSDTSITITPVISGLLYGRDYAVQVTNDAALVSTGNSISFIPANPDPATTTGERYVNVTETPATAGLRITATPDIAIGSQIHWKNAIEDTGGTPTAIDIDEIVIHGDGSMSVTTPGSRTFPINVDVRVNNDDGEGWSAFVTQSISQAAATTPVLITDPTEIFWYAAQNTSDGLDMSGLVSSGSWTWAVTSGSLPAWASLNSSTGVITGTADEYGDTGPLTVTVTGAGGSVEITLNIEVYPATGMTLNGWVQSIIYGAPDIGGVNQGWIDFLASQGYTTGSFNNRLRSWLGAQGYTGSLADRLRQFKDDNGILG